MAGQGAQRRPASRGPKRCPGRPWRPGLQAAPVLKDGLRCQRPAAELAMPIVLLLDRSPGGTQAAKEGWGVRPGASLGSLLAGVRVPAHRCVALRDGSITLSWA